jgi:hypothetical protein
MAVAWPAVKDRLVALLPTLLPTGALVFDGPVPTGEGPAAYVTVGWQPSTDDESAGSYAQARDLEGFAAAETGTVLLEFGAITGEVEMPDAFGLVDALQAYVQANQSLGGVLGGAPTVSLDVEVAQAQNVAGAVQRLLVTLTYSCQVV